MTDELLVKGVPITAAQVERLHAICTAGGVKDEQRKAIMRMYGYKSSLDICGNDYEKICNDLAEAGKGREHA